MASISPGLSLHMSQQMQMVMTPQMIQAMEMLQLPLLALEQKISQEILENPALEMQDLTDEPEAAADSAESAEEAPPDTVGELAASGDEVNDLRRVDEIDCAWDDMHDEAAPRRAGGEGEEDFDPIENAEGRARSLPEYLGEQLVFQSLDEARRDLCLRLIGQLEPTGYLRRPLAELAQPDPAEPEAAVPTEAELAEALAVVQRLDPAGVGARDLRECLLLQIDRLPEPRPLERALVDRHLADLAANRLPQIARALSCTIEEVKRVAAFLRTLDPRPGLAVGGEEPLRVDPDVVAEVDGQGRLVVRLAGARQPEISELYLALFDTTARGRQLRERYLADPEQAEGFRQMQERLKRGEEGRALREKYQAARWLIGAIAQRERTILRVSQAIAERQEPFLRGQADAPAPLMMQEIADKVGIDISTVSRAVKDKWIDTAAGLRPLRDFFARSVGPAGPGAAETSDARIKNRIRELVAAEAKDRPLKDDELQAALGREGMALARRTVAKYRAELGLPSHTRRREY